MSTVNAKPLFEDKQAVGLLLSLSGAIVASVRVGSTAKINHFLEERLLEDVDRKRLIRILNRLEAILNQGLGKVEHKPKDDMLFELPLDYKVSKDKDKWKVVKITRPVGAKPFGKNSKTVERVVPVTSRDHKVNLRISGESDSVSTVMPSELDEKILEPLATYRPVFSSFLDSSRGLGWPLRDELLDPVQEGFPAFCIYDFVHLCNVVTAQIDTKIVYGGGRGNILRHSFRRQLAVTAEGMGSTVLTLLSSHLPTIIKWVEGRKDLTGKYPKLVPALKALTAILDVVNSR